MKPKEFKTIKDLIKIYEAIPEEKWCTGNYRNGRTYCALGHLGISGDEVGQSVVLEKKLEKLGIMPHVLALKNDGSDNPKEAILKFLKSKLNTKPVKKKK